MSILVAVGLGFSFTCLLWPKQRRLLPDLLLITSFSVGLGFGITSLLFFLWLIVFGTAGVALISSEIGLLLVLSVFAGIVRLRKEQVDSLPVKTIRAPRLKSKIEWIAAITFFFTLFVAGKGFLWFVRGGIQGGWDAWGIWNLRAKFLLLGGLHWRDAFSAVGAISHTDYRLLIPASVARGWSYAGTDIPLVPILIGFLFTAATVELLFSALSVLGSRSQAFLAATFLLASSCFLVL